MRLFTRFSQGLFAASMLAASLVGMSGCGEYSLFKVSVTSKDSPRDNIDECLMTIQDENGKTVLDKYHLQRVYGDLDTSGNATLKQGCAAGGLTNANIGLFSYSRSSTSGTLTFRVDAWDTNGVVCGYTGAPGCQPLQWGKSNPVAPKAYSSSADEVGVNLEIKIQTYQP